QLATILAKLLKLPAAKDAGFTDNTADAWYYDAINRCAAAGILNGNGDGTVTPEAPITRERAMVMLARALGIEPIRKPDLTKYTDAAQVSAYAQGYVAALIEAGIVGGVTADELAPQANINRASTVTILDRAISTYADEAGKTVKADGKGIVLVVAENVKITGAPEGTKIVVADGATGLTVNGKSVSDDQTYIVPKTEPAKPSSSSSGGSVHTHTYTTFVTNWNDMTTVRKCSCGATQTIENSNTYYIANDTDLKAFRDSVNQGHTFAGKTIQLTDSIDLKNEEWTPIGTAEHPFEGTFDGQGHKITGLTNKSDATSFGLFEKVQGTVVIKNFELTVNAVAADNVNSEGWAGVVGLSNGATCDLTLEDITVKGTLTAKDKVAGLIAQAPTYANNGSKLTVKNCVNEAAVTGDRAAGICCAINTDAGNTFEKCVNKGTITAKSGKYQTAAGIVCKNEAGTVFTNCSNIGVLDASIAYTIATKLVITFGSGSRSGSDRVKEGDTYYYTQINPNIETMHNLFVGEPYSAETAVDWEQVCRTAHAVDYAGLGAGVWYDTENAAEYKVSATATNYKTLRYFKSIDEAFDHDLYNATITLSADQTLTKTKADQMSYVIDLGGNTLTANSTIHNSINGGTITIKNGTIVQASNEKLFEITNQGKLQLENVTINSEGKCIARIAAAYTGTITFDENCSISGYIDLSGNPATNVVINGTTYSREAGQYVYIDNNDVSYGFTKIATPDQLKAFAADVNGGADYAGKFIKLTADIDLSNTEWTPIGNESGKAFAGTFDGNNKTISNLKITGGGYIGLFGYITGGAEIKNVRLAGADVSGSERVGGLVGQIIGNATVANCSIDAASKVTGNDSNTGGLIGAAQCGSASTISLSSLTNYAAVTNTASSNSRAGGIIGQVTRNANVTITNCHNHGVLSAANGYAGGIVAAYQNGSLTINGCTNTKPLSDFTGAHKADLIAWITSVRALTINADGEVSGDMIGYIESDYSRNFKINGSCYFLNKTSESFTFVSALQNKQSLNTAKMDRIIDFYTFAKTKNSNFATYPNSNEYWEMFTSTGGFGGDGWPQLLKQYNEAYPDRNLKQEEFTPTWRDAIMYFYKPAQGE
ncbi:S-layer homology domain-containing protein, partial [Oscillibacter sp. MSJ-31]|uniref:S-layer homology domain-containing protein n=1 Tax=Oscillibacter sp. MSJ-31 TaxID=2841526 RepID=UPI001C1221AB